MQSLIPIVRESEDWLMDRVLQYAKELGYTAFTSTLHEDWRLSVASLSDALILAMDKVSTIPELLPEEDFSLDPIASFGIVEAKRHRDRGVTLGMFLALMKYYRQSYLDLVYDQGLEKEEERAALLFVLRFFDRVELGFCIQWTQVEKGDRVEEMARENRRLANEKNRFYTVFESLPFPAAVLDEQSRIVAANSPWMALFDLENEPGAVQSLEVSPLEPLPWLKAEMAMLDAEGGLDSSFEKELKTSRGKETHQVRLRRLQDVSEKYPGAVVTLPDA